MIYLTVWWSIRRPTDTSDGHWPLPKKKPHPTELNHNDTQHWVSSNLSEPPDETSPYDWPTTCRQRPPLNTPQTVTLAAAEDTDLANGSAVFNVTSAGLTTVNVTGTETDNDTQSLVVSSTSLSVTEGLTNTYTELLACRQPHDTPQTVTPTTYEHNIRPTIPSYTPGTHLKLSLTAAEDTDLANGRLIHADDRSVTGTETIRHTSLVVSSTSLSVTEGLTNTFTVRLAYQPAGNVTVSVARASGDTDLSVSGGASLTFTSANWNTPQTVTLTAPKYDLPMVGRVRCIHRSDDVRTNRKITITGVSSTNSQ